VKNKNKLKWLTKIESREDALIMVKDTSMVFFVVAGFMAAVSFVLGFSLLIDAALYALCGFFLRRYKSRTAAVILFILASCGVVVSFANMTGADLGGGKNIVLAVAVLWAAIRAVEASYKLSGCFSTEPLSDVKPPS